MRDVPASEIFDSRPVSSPEAMATTPSRTATPSTLRTVSPILSEPFMAVKTLPPTNSASAREVAAPSA